MKASAIGDVAEDYLPGVPMMQVSASKLDADEKTAWILAFGVLLIVATMGNSLVTWFIIGTTLYGFQNKFYRKKINL